MPGGFVFGILMRMYTYHYTHPYVYILIPVFFYSLFVLFFYKKLITHSKWSKVFLLLGIMLATVVISSPFGGLLWVYYDIQSGFVPETTVLIHNLTWGAVEGLKLGWIIVGISIPYNILGIVIGIFVTQFMIDKYLSDTQST